MSHTPGPWHVNCDGYFRIVGDAEYAPIARINGIGPASQANAHLIAASPDLLEALEEFVDTLGFAAIAKARGEA